MYLGHFKFKLKPFALNPDPAFMYPSEHHAKALTMLEYAIESQSPFCMLTGEIGSGKTTLVRHLIRTLDRRMTVGLISHTHQRFRSIYPWALSALSVVPRDTSDIAQHETLTDYIIGQYGKGKRTLLIFDEAQNLSVQTLEELRLLSNINSEDDVALQTVLVGQPELREKMARPELRQFAQRISIDYHLQALTLLETEFYVRHRLQVAGGRDSIFRQSAIRYIHKITGGVPRLINQMCDLSLVYAFAQQRDRVDAVVVAQVMQDRRIAREGKPPSPEQPRPSAAPVKAADDASPPRADDGAVRERA
jgi:type II secretory pathway predicted ATPase ExeA